MSSFWIIDAVDEKPCKDHESYCAIMKQIQQGIRQSLQCLQCSNKEDETLLENTLYTAYAMLRMVRYKEPMLHVEEEQKIRCPPNDEFGLVKHGRIPLTGVFPQVIQSLANVVHHFYKHLGLAWSIPKCEKERDELGTETLYVDMGEFYEYESRFIGKLEDMETSENFHGLSVQAKAIVRNKDTRHFRMYRYAVEIVVNTQLQIEEDSMNGNHVNNQRLNCAFHTIYVVEHLLFEIGELPGMKAKIVTNVIYSCLVKVETALPPFFRDLIPTITIPSVFIQRGVHALKASTSARVLRGLCDAFPDDALELLFGRNTYLADHGVDILLKDRVFDPAFLEDICRTIKEEVQVWFETGNSSILYALNTECGRLYRKKIYEIKDWIDALFQEEETPPHVAPEFTIVEQPTFTATPVSVPALDHHTPAQDNFPYEYHGRPDSHPTLEAMSEFFAECIPLPLDANWKVAMPRRRTEECRTSYVRLRNNIDRALIHYITGGTYGGQPILVTDVKEFLEKGKDREMRQQFLTAIVQDIYLFALKECSNFRIRCIDVKHAAFLYNLLRWADPKGRHTNPHTVDNMWRLYWRHEDIWFLLVKDGDDNPVIPGRACKSAYDAYDAHKKYSLLPALEHAFGRRVDDMGPILNGEPIDNPPPFLSQALSEQVELRLEYYKRICNEYRGPPVLHASIHTLAVLLIKALRST